MIRLPVALAALVLLVSGTAQAQDLGYGIWPTPLSSGPPPTTGITPLFLGHQSTTNEPSTSVVSYSGPGNAWSTTETSREWTMPTAGSISALTASYQTAVTGSQVYIVKFLDVTASSSLGGANSTINSTTAYFNDLADGSLSVAAGDLFTVSSDPNSTTPAAQATSSGVSFLLTTTDGTSALFASAAANVSASAQNYQAFGGPKISATEINVSSIVPGPTAGSSVGTLDHLYAHGGATPASGKGYAVLLYQNGAVSAQGGGSTCEAAIATFVSEAAVKAVCTCVISSTSANCNNASSSDAAVTINAGDTISIETYPYQTPATTTVNPSMRYTPVTPSNSLAFGVAATLPTGITSKYGQNSGFTANTATEVQAVNTAPAALHVLDLWSAIDTVAPSGDTRTQTLRGGASGSLGASSLTCGIGNSASGITVGGVANSPACHDLTAGHSFSSGAVTSTPQYLDILTSQNAGTTSIAAWYKTSTVITVP